MATGSAMTVAMLHRSGRRLRRRFGAAMAMQQFDADDVVAGRAYIAARMAFYKYLEGGDHDHGHQPFAPLHRIVGRINRVTH